MAASASSPMSHTLFPQLAPGVQRAFDPLCSPLAPAEVAQVKAEVENHVGAIRLASRRNEFLDVVTAERIGAVLAILLDQYQVCPEPHQALIAGAARYFVRELDVDPDTTSLLGLEDDAAVLNFVLDAITQPELKVQTDE
jgi:uncharacterized membrane protein YkvA (DUF1232 family)